MVARISSAVAIVRRPTNVQSRDRISVQSRVQSRGATIKATMRHAMKREASHAKYAKACRQTGLLLNGLLPSDLLSSGRRNRW